jgi:circadian clock protein KaiC
LGNGKTLQGMEFLVRGIEEHGEQGAFMCSKERDLAENVASLDLDLALIAGKKLIIAPVTIDRADMLQTGEYNLDDLIIRLGAAIHAVGTKRVVLDTIGNSDALRTADQVRAPT